MITKSSIKVSGVFREDILAPNSETHQLSCRYVEHKTRCDPQRSMTPESQTQERASTE